MARRFRDAAAEVRASNPGWAITIAFYSALQWARAYVGAKHGDEPRTHRDMDALFRTRPELQQIEVQYHALYTQSRQQRYDCVTYSAEQAAKYLSLAKMVENWCLQRIRGVDPTLDPEASPPA